MASIGALSPPILPPFYSANFLYVRGATRLSCIGYWGENGISSEGGFPYHSSRIDILSSEVVGQGGLTALDVIFKTNGSALRSSYWATIEGGGAIGTACASGALPVPFEGIQWDWLNTPTPGEDGLTFLGNETVTLPLTPPQQVLAAHWQSASTCQDMWLVPMATPPGAPPGLPYSAPVLYTLADASSAPSCDHNNRTFAFTYVESHTAAEYANDSPVFTLPPPCIALLGPEGNGRGGSSAGGGSSTDGPGIPVVWVTVASALAAVLGAVVGFVVFRKVAVARLRRRGGGGGGRSGRGEGGGIGIGGGGLGGGVGRGGGGGWDLPDDGPRGAGGGYLQPLMDGF